MTGRPDVLVLHVLAGPNQGGEMVLSVGDWLIGSGSDADLAFAEPSLAASHVQLSVAADSVVTIVALAEGVLVQNRALAPGEPGPLAALAVVAVGSTHFTVGPPGAAWDTAGHDAGAPVEEVLLTAVAPTPRRRAGRGRLWSGGALLVALLASAGGAWWLATSSPPPPVFTGPTPLERARAVIAELGLTDAVQVARSGDRIAATGQVSSEDSVVRLAAAFRRAGIQADVSVTTDSALLEAVATVLRHHGADVTAHVAGPGRVELHGFIPAGEPGVIDVVGHLRNDVPGLRSIVDDLITQDRAAASLQSGLRDAGMLPGIVFNPTPTGFRVTGDASPASLARWADVARAFDARYGRWLHLETMLVPTSTVAPDGLRLGRRPMLIMADGRRLGVGDNLDDTSRITAIDGSRVRISTAFGEADIPYARAPRWIMEDDDNG